MRLVLWHYTGGTRWIEASELVAETHDRGPYFARRLRSWIRAFLEDRHNLPVNTANTWNRSALENEDLELAITEHLQSLGKYVRSADIVDFLATPSVQQRFGLSKTISLSTAHGWMYELGYRWQKTPNGQYVDGHEREDVVQYRQDVYLPALNTLRPRLRQYTEDGAEVAQPPLSTADSSLSPRRLARIFWQDESTFFANDRRVVRWVHGKEKPVPRAKGEGVSLMVSDFFSAEDGWLRTADGTLCARQLFKPGKNRDGYFNNDDVLRQFHTAADIAQARWPDDDIVFIVDNAPTHQKRAPGSLSARSMPKNPSKTFSVETPVLDDAGRPAYGTDGKILKTRIPMSDAKFSDGTPQALYYAADHPNPELRGAFKGMAVLLEERGYPFASRLRAQCDGFKCTPPPPGTAPLDFYAQNPCCCRRLLYEQPDFKGVKSRLETEMESRGVQVIFLPKFHCELNPIEQCWGYAKRDYREKPSSSKEADLEKNVVEALDSVPLKSMRRFYTRSLRFADAYTKGLSGKQAAWASKKYRGHRVIPESIFTELTDAGISAE
ncbi:hypothetical protein FKP32DRAFT_1615362 [Trametes sanguinea]|nr:hypothetical protein FKP32DRAFT_1615362 [Trametes sanguinea]